MAQTAIFIIVYVPKYCSQGCSPAELITLHLVNQNSIYFIYEKSTIFDHITFFSATRCSEKHSLKD